jgi:hypothetical protein
MPFLHDVAHDGWLCSVYIYYYISATEIPAARSWAAPIANQAARLVGLAIWPSTSLVLTVFAIRE